MAELEQPQPPGETYVHQRWVPAHRVEWAKQCDAILLEHGAVSGSRTYSTRYKARWRSQYLIQLLTELRLHERWELREHIDRRDGGYLWSVEHVRSANDARSSPAH